MADDEELLGGLFGGGQPPWMNFLSAAASIPTRQERLMGRGRGGGYTYQPPDNRVAQAAMLRERQQQAEVADLMRVQEMYGQALEWSPDDAEESLKHVMHLYQNASEPFKTTTGARAFIGMIPKMREEAVKARAGKNLRAGVGGALGQLDPMATPEDFVRLLIQNEVDPATAAALAKIHGESFYTGSPASGMGTRARWGGGGAEQRVGTHFQPPGAGGVPAQQYEFDAQGNIIGRVVPGSVGVQPDKPLLQWTGEEGRAPSPPGFGGIQHTPQQPPIMPPELEIAAPDQPINLRRPGMPEPMGDRPIDPGRPVIPGLPGPVGLGPGQATEETITLDMGNGQQLLLPTIVDGQRVTPVQALALYRMGRNDPVGVYGSQEEAQRAAEARSQRIGQVRGMGDQPAGPRTLYTPPELPLPPGMEAESVTRGGVTYKKAGGGQPEKFSQRVVDILLGQPPAGPPGSPERMRQTEAARQQARQEENEDAKLRAALSPTARQGLQGQDQIHGANVAYLDTKTGLNIPPTATWEDVAAGMRDKRIAQVPDQPGRDFVQTARQSFDKIMRFRKVVEGNDVVWPKTDPKNLPAATLAVLRAQAAKAITSRTDPELAWALGQGRMEALAISRAAGDNRLSDEDRRAGFTAMGLEPMSKAGALRMLDDIADAYRNRLKGRGFDPDGIIGPDPRQRQGGAAVREGYMRVVGPGGRKGQVPLGTPLDPGWSKE